MFTNTILRTNTGTYRCVDTITSPLKFLKWGYRRLCQISLLTKVRKRKAQKEKNYE